MPPWIDVRSVSAISSRCLLRISQPTVFCFSVSGVLLQGRVGNIVLVVFAHMFSHVVSGVFAYVSTLPARLVTESKGGMLENFMISGLCSFVFGIFFVLCRRCPARLVTENQGGMLKNF